MKKRLLFITFLLLLLMALPLSVAASDGESTEQASPTKLIAITFDVGPGSYTARLLDALKETGRTRYFFLCW